MSDASKRAVEFQVDDGLGGQFSCLGYQVVAFCEGSKDNGSDRGILTFV